MSRSSSSSRFIHFLAEAGLTAQWPSFVAAIALLSVAASLLVAQSSTHAQAAVSAAHIVNGKQLYQTVGCNACHNLPGEGVTVERRIAPNPVSAQAMQAYVRNPSGLMMPFAPDVVSDRDAADIYAYLKSVPRPITIGSLPPSIK